MKTYKAVFSKDVKGVYGISLVSDPAMEENFLSFSKQEKDIKFTSVDEEKRILLGLVLEPNKLVPRYDSVNNEMYNVLFDEESIRDVAYNFQKQGYQSNSTIEHQGKKLDGVSFVETWLVDNPEMDKSLHYGLTYPKGSWVAMMKVDSDEIWNDYVKTGIVKGFSIDAGVHFREVNLNNQVNMSKSEETGKSIAEKLLSFFKSEVKLSDEVKEEVISEEVKATEVEKVEAIELAPESVEEVKEPETIEMSKVDGLKEFTIELAKEVKGLLKPLEDKNLELSKEVKELNELVVELGKQPAATSISSAPVQLEYSNMSNVQKMAHNRNNK